MPAFPNSASRMAASLAGRQSSLFAVRRSRNDLTGNGYAARASRVAQNLLQNLLNRTWKLVPTARGTPQMANGKSRLNSAGGREARRVAAELDGLLSCDRYPLHSRLPPERRLCELLQVNRTALRSGLDELEREGRIWRHVGKGTFVGGRPQSVQSCAEALGADTTLSELLETRTLIEPQAARLAALRAEPSDLTRMKRHGAHAAMAEDWATWDRWDELLHRGIVEASGNGLMISIVDQILRVKKQTRWTITRAKMFDPDLKDRYSSEHLAVIASIEAHDLQGAENAMRRHIQGISSSIGPVVSRTASATPRNACDQGVATHKR